MGLLDDMLNRNPTRTWEAAPGLVPSLDLDNGLFCGVRLGGPSEALRKLGPASDAAAARRGSYRYPALGVEWREEDGRFVEVECAFDPSDDATTFAGMITRHGRSLSLGSGTTESDLLALLGPPAERRARPAEDGEPATVTLTWSLQAADCTADLEDDQLRLLWLGTRT